MTAMTAREHALRVATLEALKEAVTAEYEAARAEAEPVFASKYHDEGNDRQAVLLPSGERVGQLTIKAPAPVVGKPDGAPAGWTREAALLEWCEAHFPAAVEEFIDPAKAGSLDVIAAVRDKLGDGVIKRRVRSATAKVLTEEMTKGGGKLADRRTGEPDVVAAVAPGKATGAFAFTGANSAERRDRLMAALLAGELRGVVGFGPLALPAPEEPRRVPTDAEYAAMAEKLYRDEHGFRGPEAAAAHARFVQGGYSTPPIEAYRMIRGGGVGAERALAWLAEHGLNPDDPARGANTPWPLPADWVNPDFDFDPDWARTVPGLASVTVVKSAATRRAGSGSGRAHGFPPAVAALLDTRDPWCVYCGSPYGLRRHHRRLKGIGGDGRDHTQCACNGVRLCADHHAWAHSGAGQNEARAEGLIIPRSTVEPWTLAVLVHLEADSGGLLKYPSCDGRWLDAAELGLTA